MRKWAFGAAALVVLSAIVYSGLWWIGSDRLRQGLDDWAAEMRARGWSISYENLRIRGFPGALTPILDAPSIVFPETRGGWRWHGPRLTAKLWPWNLGRMSFEGPGIHRIQKGDEAQTPIRLDMRKASGVALFSTAEETRIVLTLGEIAIRAPDRALPHAVKHAKATIVLPDRPGRADQGRGPEPPGPTIALQAERIDLAGMGLPGPGGRIDALSLKAKVIGPLPRGKAVEALAVWRAGGGTVEIDDVSIRWQRGSVNGSGTVTVDRNLQPIAALSVRIGGHRDLLRMLVAHGAVAERDAGAIQFGLELLARGSSGRSDIIALPLTVQDRRLYLGPIAVMRLQRIDWRG